MAFALALQSVHDLPEGHGQTIFTATTAIVVLTVGTLTLIKSKLSVFSSLSIHSDENLRTNYSIPFYSARVHLSVGY
jgi:hypothetical protein